MPKTPKHLEMLNELRIELVRRRTDASVINALTRLYEEWLKEEKGGKRKKC